MKKSAREPHGGGYDLDFDVEKATRNALKGARNAARAEAERLLAESNKRVPTDTGRLRGSGHVTRSHEGGEEEAYDVVYDAPYAILVHEKTAMHHDDGGEAKFLENAANAVQSELLAHAAAEVRRALGT